jgi:hypothetical protein
MGVRFLAESTKSKERNLCSRVKHRVYDSLIY